MISLYKIKTGIRRFLNRHFRMYLPGSHPFITGNGFRNIANFAYDQFTDLNPKDVMFGDVVFVRIDALKEFWHDIHPRIEAPYVLVSHNEDGSVGPEYAPYIDDKIIHWYSQNLCFKHSKATPLPIGIQNFPVKHPENFIQPYLKFLKDTQGSDETMRKKDRILFAFTVGTDIPERLDARAASDRSNISDWIIEPRIAHYKTLATYKFMASPRGAGMDCHRTWEALHFRVIPILLRSQFSEQLLQLGFPLLLIDDWSDIVDMTPEFLADYYEKKKAGFNTPLLHLPYWQNLISSHRFGIRPQS